jgi:hypothetical protein
VDYKAIGSAALISAGVLVLVFRVELAREYLLGVKAGPRDASKPNAPRALYV